MRITILAGGVGGARFLRGLVHHLHPDAGPGPGHAPGTRDAAEITGITGVPEITVIGNTGDDITLFGLRVCPDLDTVMYTLGGGVHEAQGWGRSGETHAVQAELAAYGVEPQWFGLGDRDIATHVARTRWLGQGLTLSEVTSRLGERWGLPRQGVRLLPMTDEPVETHVVVEDADAEGGQRAMHFQEWWVRHQAALPAERFVVAGMDRARPAPGVLEAIRTADLVILPPSNPVVSIGIILTVPGVRDALRGTRAPVVGVSPVVGGRPVRGYADACLAALGLPTTTDAVAGLYADFLDGWLVDDADAGSGEDLSRRHRGLVVEHRPLLMTDVPAAAAIAGAAVDLGRRLQRA